MFPVNLQDAVRNLGKNASLRISNGVRTPDRYLFQTILPTREVRSYHAEDANVTIRTTAAPMAAMDGTFGPVGLMEASTFTEGTIKLGPSFKLTEEMRRTIREYLENLMWQGVSDANIMNATQVELLNIQDKLILQSMWDRIEWIRAQALVEGAIDWTFGDKRVQVSYGVPAANFLANETGNDAWDGSSSDFWDNIATLQTRLNFDIAYYIAHPTTITKIIGNTVNNVAINGDWLGAADPVNLMRMDTIGGIRVPYPDGRFNITLIPYGEEMEIYDLSNPGRTTKIPFMPTGKILAIGRNRRNDYRVGEGATDDPNKDLDLGYTHLGPTEEADGAPGFWTRTYVPEDMPMQVQFQGACNFLPVIQAASKIAVASSDLS